MIATLGAFALAQAALGAAPSASQPLASPKTPATASVGAEKVICKTLPQTGSLFTGPKECHSKAEWEVINAASRDNVNSYQQRSRQTGGG